MRKLEVSFVASLIVIVVLTTSTFYFYNLGVLQENQNKSLSGQIQGLQNKKNVLIAQNSGLEDDIDDLESQVSTLKIQKNNAYDEGYDIGYLQGVADGAGRGYNIRDPTYQEVLDLIALDQTDKNEYDEDTYNCFDFTADVEKSAFVAGYRCGLVYIELILTAHSIVAFNTTNQGLIFIEPQTDDVVDLTIGEFYETDEFWIGTVQDYTIVW